ncbi:MAG TPA: diaminopimelate epimerase [Vicinamibacterales bacterium]|nr:diaminopimelate epimerase [Vicinamibacterales bacterium]
MRFAKAHAYGNDFLYIRSQDVAPGVALDALARELCERHTGIGADGLILYEPTPDGASMRLLNADGSWSEVSGNGVRGLAALLLQGDGRTDAAITIHSEGGVKQLVRTGSDGSRQTFRAAMGLPEHLRQMTVTAAGESIQLAVMNFGNPQCVALGPLPDEARFNRLGPALERHEMFPARSNVEFAHVVAPDAVRILIWERGVGPTTSSGTGSCASLIAAAAFGGAARDAIVIAPGGRQRVEWLEDSVYLTGWAEVLVEGDWRR